MKFAALIALASLAASAVVSDRAHAAAEEAKSAPLSRAVSSKNTDEKRGYWWKRESKPTDEPPDERILPPPPDEAALLKLHPKDVEKMIEDYRQFALWQMTPQHVIWYYQLQDFARRRARAFMNVTALVMLENPDMNMQTVYPTNPPGQAARVAQRQESVTQRLLAERGNAALVMLTREGCQYCEAMRAIIKYFQERYGWSVRELDVDAQPEAAAHFATQYTPTTVVIFRNSSDWMPVAVGVETVEALEEGVYRALRYVHGETSAEQYTLQEFEDGGLYDPRR